MIHAANNATAVLLVASGTDEAGRDTSTNRLLVVFVIYAAVAVASLAFVRRRLNVR